MKKCWIVLAVLLLALLALPAMAADGTSGWCDNCNKQTTGVWWDLYETANMQYNETQHTTKLFQCDKCRSATYTWADHEWQDATCAAPETCLACGATRGGKKAHNYEWIPGSQKPATCTTPFYLGTYICKCGAIDPRSGQPQGEPLGHEGEGDGGYWRTIGGKKCKDATEIGLYCGRPNCGEVLEKKSVTPAKCHAPNLVQGTPRIEPTCESIGYTAHSYCRMCDTEYGFKEIPALGHDYENGEWRVITEPTCQGIGWIGLYCAREGCTKYEHAKSVPKVDHSWYQIFDGHPATCTETGETESYACRFKYCTEHIWGEEIPALGHTGVGAEWEVTKEATCEEEGEMVLRCTRINRGWRCNQVVESQVIPKACNPADLELLEEAIPVTCETYGRTAKYHCSRCDSIIGGERISPRGHYYSTESQSEKVVIPATCEMEGLKVNNFCLNPGCTSGEYSTIPALGHHFVTLEAKANTCTEYGWDAHEACDREGCGFSAPHKEYGAKGHDIESHTAQAATCTEIGWDAYDTCSRCSYSTYVELPALGHETVHYDAQTATCTTGGWSEYDGCTRCDYSTEHKVYEAKGHLLELVSAQLSTCLEIGWNEYETCLRDGCDYSTYIELPAQGHKNMHYDAQKPTCEQLGWEEFDICSRCGYSTFTEIPALGHKTVKYSGKAPTCTGIGWNAYEICQREGCSYNTYQEKAAKGHLIVNIGGKTPTCTKPGWDAFEICLRLGCGYTTYSERPALNHWYGEWTPNSNATNTASCLRACGQVYTQDCERFGFALRMDGVRTQISLCPVCGEVSDGARLLMAEASAVCITHRPPAGEIIVRTGALNNGAVMMSVAFESRGEVTRPTGLVEITLPAEAVQGYALHLLAEDGTETALEVTVNGANASFTLDFGADQTPVRLIHLLPQA